jgi:D-alanyl-lipoteichoic acid acyltransferase DltB (MBOAT superfamily)
MLFNSYQFTFGFLPVVLVLFWALTILDARRATAALLILASLFFYAWWNWHFLVLFGFSILFNFGWSLMLAPPAGSTDPRRESIRRALLAIGITVNLALLGYFKYRDFFLHIAATTLGVHGRLTPLVLPLAISFFTFEQITYLTGAWRGEPGHGDFVSYLLFIAFFPHLIAGPIVRYPEIYPQLNRASQLRLSVENLNEGLMIFVIGLFKKVILADSFRLIVNPLFDNATTLAFFDAWGAALAFGLEIYFDFSGYSDMAIGLARIFGVRFPENFDSPYKSRSVIEFWRRWHMTLSFFLRDYLYIPLGGNRHGELRRHLNLFVTMLLGGLWHGANWTFVIWGALHGLFLSINHLWSKSARRLPDVAAWTLTFILVTGAWVFFRAPTFARAKIIFTAMAGLNGIAFTSSNYSIGWPRLEQIGIGLIIVFFCPNRQTIMAWRWPSDWRYALAFAALGGVSVMAMSNPPPFIYFQF